MTTKKTSPSGFVIDILKFATSTAKGIITDVLLPETVKQIRRRFRSK